MKHDINILPILTKFDDTIDNVLTEDSFYPVENYGGDNYLKLSYGLALNGSPLDDYNIYIVINAYGKDSRYDFLAGGFRLVKARRYDSIIFKKNFIKFLDGMEKNMDITIYKLPLKLDKNNPNLREGEFEDNKNINIDLSLVEDSGIFTSATTFKLSSPTS